MGPKRKNGQKGYTLITGASSGIGREFARQCAQQGHNLFLIARRRERLEALQKELSSRHCRVAILPLDLCLPGAIEELSGVLHRKKIQVTGLINNAGLGSYKAFLEDTPEALENMLQLNMNALTLLTHAIASEMKARGSGRILMVASTASFQPVPYHAVYSATKAYVLSLGVALTEEFKAHGIQVTTLCPGLTESEFFDVADFKTSQTLEKVTMKASEVAAIGLNAWESGKTVQVAGLFNQVSRGMVKLMPTTWVTRLMAKAQQMREGKK